MEKLRAAVNEFDRFQQLMRSRDRYDFDDMINWVIKAFEENPALLNRYQEQFLYILVDEFLDTSGTQNQLVKLLISFGNHPTFLWWVTMTRVSIAFRAPTWRTCCSLPNHTAKRSWLF